MDIEERNMNTNRNRNFDIALSFSAEDKWIANDIYLMLKKAGFNVYCSTNNPDFAGGFLRTELRDIYKKSIINVMLLSCLYENKPNDSIVAMERRELLHRHLRNEAYSLFILRVDNVTIPNDIEQLTVQTIQDVGINGATKMIINRLINCYSVGGQPLNEIAHPKNCENHRGQMNPCEFRLSPNYKQDGLGRWDILGDVLVVPIRSSVPKTLKTFLIPSSASPPFLSHSTLIQTEPRTLDIKQKTSKAFYEENKGKNLRGVLFYIEKNGMYLPHIYCREYDIFLVNNWHKYDNQRDNVR